ncbi:lanthionine synthetase LanC family protein [Eubacterium limosum]|uniref:lanthionine synthetase LanC family protein n=1 Tax=Eubacterium limosum TaxID=1736 RepID=UPI0010631549|nr:lanthionine synthetase LanC family protein [Eubacterium limosum]
MKKIYYSFIKENIINEITKITEYYFKQLDININRYNLSNESLPAHLNNVTTVFDDISQEKWLKNSYIIMEMIKDLIENNRTQGYGLFSGLGELFFSVKCFEKKTGYFKNFANSFEKLFLRSTQMYLSYCLSHLNNLREAHYDIIAGLSGAGIIILNCCEQSSESTEVITGISEYLLLILKNKNVYGETIPAWHIPAKNNVYKIRGDNLYSKGYFDFGFAHGICGPALFLSKVYTKNILPEKIREALKNIETVYTECRFQSEFGFYNWPSQLAFDDYIKKNIHDSLRKSRMSWCYGAIGISRALYLETQNCNNIKNKFYLENIIEISQQNVSAFRLESPIMCHGYAGLLSIINRTYRESKQKELETIQSTLIECILKCYSEEYEYGFANTGSYEINNAIIKGFTNEQSTLSGAPGVIQALCSLFYRETILDQQFCLI